MCPVRRNVPSRAIEHQTHDDRMSAVWRYGNVCRRGGFVWLRGAERGGRFVFRSAAVTAALRKTGRPSGIARIVGKGKGGSGAGCSGGKRGVQSYDAENSDIASARAPRTCFRSAGSGRKQGGRGHGQPRRELVQTVLIFYGQRDVNGGRAEDGRAAYHAASSAHGAKSRSVEVRGTGGGDDAYVA